MRPSLISPLFVVALIAFLSCQPTVVKCMFNHFDKFFQIELLDDCSVYMFDRVQFIPEVQYDWCKLPKSSLSVSRAFQRRLYKDALVIIAAIYANDTDRVTFVELIPGGDHYNHHIDDFLQQKVLDEVTSNSAYGRYNLIFLTAGKYGIEYESCKYGKTKSKNRANLFHFYNVRDTKITYEKRPDCDSNTMYDISFQVGKVPVFIKVVADPNHPGQFQGSATDETGTQTMFFRPIKQSIQTCVLAYRWFSNLRLSFPYEPYLTKITNYQSNFIGARLYENAIEFNNTYYEKKTQKMKSDYIEQPFFFYDVTDKKYSPLFLYYKFKGANRQFTVRFLHVKKFHDIFTPMEYMKQCGFPTSDLSVTVAAAPRVIEQKEESISIEVYFIINNVDFQFCIFNVVFKYHNAQSNVRLTLKSDINAYAHVEKRSTTAANCDYNGQTVRWLLAYSSNGDAELVSLDNSVSSPIFPCPHCGPDSKMYCDISPDAKKYHSALFIQTINNDKTDITYVRIIKGRGYELSVHYHTTSLVKKYCFLQNILLKMELREIWKAFPPTQKPDTHKVTQKPVKPITLKVTQKSIKPDKSKVTQKPDQPDKSKVTHEPATTEDPFLDDDYIYDPDWLLGVGNSFTFSWWLLLFVFVFLA